MNVSIFLNDELAGFLHLYLTVLGEWQLIFNLLLLGKTENCQNQYRQNNQNHLSKGFNKNLLMQNWCLRRQALNWSWS